MMECLIYLVIWAILALICWIVIQKVLAIFWGGADSTIMQLVGLLLGLLLLLQTLRCMGFLGRIIPPA